MIRNGDSIEQNVFNLKMTNGLHLNASFLFIIT